MSKKVANFNDFCKNCEVNKIMDVKRSIKPNSSDEQQHIGNKKWKWNKSTKKWDDIAPDMIDDKLKSLSEVSEMRQHHETSNIVLNRLDIIEPLSKLDNDDPEFKERFTQNDVSVAINFIKNGNPSEWYLEEIVKYLKEKGIEVSDEIYN
jgi:hypothetical protein